MIIKNNVQRYCLFELIAYAYNLKTYLPQYELIFFAGITFQLQLDDVFKIAYLWGSIPLN